jgi:hypothetical protein
MFSHIKSLSKMGVGEVHSGSSMPRAGASASSGAGYGSSGTTGGKSYKSALPSRSERAKIVAGKVTGGAGPKPAFGSGGARIRQGVQGQSRAVKSGPAKSTGKSAASFERRKGVVNTIGGAKDTTRREKADSGGVRKGSGNINGFGGLVEARAPTKSLHSKPAAASGSGSAPAAKAAPARRGGVGGTVGGGAGSKSKSGAAARRSGAGGKAGGSGGAPASSAAEVRAARAAFLARFE